MLTPSQPIIPPAPKVHAKDLPLWRLLPAFTHNTVSTLPDYVFDASISRRRVLGINTLLVNDPEGIRHVTATAIGKYKRPMSGYRVFRPVAGSGLPLADGSEWRRQRRMLAPIFTPASVGLLLTHFVTAAKGLVRRIEGTPSANLSVAFQQATLDAVLRALFSLPDTDVRERLAALVRGYLAGPGRPTILDTLARTESAFAFATRKRRRFQTAWAAAIDDVVARRRQAAASLKHSDLVGLLLVARDPETGWALSAVEIRDQCRTMIATGYGTTARLLFWATYLLTLDLDQQDRVRAEVAAFTPDRVTRLDDLNNWSSVRQTLLEALRLYPPVAFIIREAIADDIVAGEEVGPGTLILISPWVLHRHRKFWSQPTAFMPDRFAGTAASWDNEGSYMPFGAGPRICIGGAFGLAAAQIILAMLLSRFRIKCADFRPVLPVARVTMTPSYEPLFELERV
jgi:cytochrome P450